MVIYQPWHFATFYIDGSVQDCSNSIANTLGLLQSCTKPSIWCITLVLYFWATWCSHEAFTLQLRYNERDRFTNHQRLDCLLNRWFRPRSRKTSELRVGNSPVTVESHKRPVKRKMFPFDDVTMTQQNLIMVALQHREAVHPIQYGISIVVLCFVVVISLFPGPLFKTSIGISA